MPRFDDQDLTDAEFRECDLTRARLVGVVMQDAVIDGLISNLVVNGVEVTLTSTMRMSSSVWSACHIRFGWST